MLVFFFPFFWKISAVTYTTACARVRLLVFERHQRSDFFVEKLYGMRARVLSLCMRLPARHAGPPATAWLLSEYTRRQRRKVDKCRVADKKKTNQQTNRQTNTHYSFIGIDVILGEKTTENTRTQEAKEKGMHLL